MTEDDDIDGLAAEYVLGSLDPAERRQVDARRKTDASLAAAIAAWERRLGPLSDRGRDVAPPAHLFDGILIAPFGDCELGNGAIQLSAGDEFTFPKFDHPVVAKTRFLEYGRRLTDQ